MKAKIMTAIFSISVLMNYSVATADEATKAATKIEFSAKESGSPWSTKKFKDPEAKWQIDYIDKNMEILEDEEKGEVIELSGFKPKWQTVTLLDKEFVKNCGLKGGMNVEFELKPLQTEPGKMFFRMYCVVPSASRPGIFFTVPLNLFADKIVCDEKEFKVNLLNRWNHIKFTFDTKNNKWVLEYDGRKVMDGSIKPYKTKHPNYVWFGDGSRKCAGSFLINKLILSNN